MAESATAPNGELARRHSGENITRDTNITRKWYTLKDQPKWINDIIQFVEPYTVTSPERVAALCNAIEYIVCNQIKGDIVECGVGQGGSAMAVALALKFFDDIRSIHLFDTFDGMTTPGPEDINHRGESAMSIMILATQDHPIWCRCSLSGVVENMRKVKYPGTIHYVAGKVEDTLPDPILKDIALLRLDTDFYSSTTHELKHLYPWLVHRGVLIVDDYGHWQGAQKAVDEYFVRYPMLLNRIDYSGRIGVRT